MADVPVRRDRSPERSILAREDRPRFGLHSRWDDTTQSPWSMMRRLGDEMDRWFGGSQHGGGIWSPSVDVRERDNNLIVSADLPGVNKEDVKIEVTNEGLLIQGERKQEHEERQQGYYRSERSYGSFSRLIPIPEGANIEQARAQFRDGVLEITVPIPQSAQTRREIPIETAPKTRTSGGGAA